MSALFRRQMLHHGGNLRASLLSLFHCVLLAPCLSARLRLLALLLLLVLCALLYSLAQSLQRVDVHMS